MAAGISLAGFVLASPSWGVLPANHVVVGDWADQSVRIFDCDTGALIAVVPGLIGSARHIAVAPDGRRAAVATDEAVFVINLDSPDSPTVASMYDSGHTLRAGVAWTPDGRSLLVVNEGSREWLRADAGLQLVGTLGGFGTAGSKPAALPDGTAILIGGPGIVGADEALSPPAVAPMTTRSVVIGETSGATRVQSLASASDAHLAVALEMMRDAALHPIGTIVLLALPTLEPVSTVVVGPCNPTSAVVVPALDAAFVLDAGDPGAGGLGRVLKLSPLGPTMAVTESVDLGFVGTGAADPELVRLADGRLVTTSFTGGRLVVLKTQPSLAIENSFDIGGRPLTLASAPAPRWWSVHRGNSPSQVLLERSPATLSPFDDDAAVDPARLDDGRTLFYNVTETWGPDVLLRVDKLPSGGTIRLTWRDFDATTDPVVSAALSSVVADAGCHGLGQALEGVHANLVDVLGDPVGIAEGLEAIPASVAPAHIARPWRSDPSGTWASLSSDVATSVMPEISVGGVLLRSMASAQFSATAPTLAIDAPTEAAVGEPTWAYAVVDGGVLPYTLTWDLDEDGSIDAVGDGVEWAFSEPGPHVVSVNIVDAEGCVNRAVHAMSVQ